MYTFQLASLPHVVSPFFSSLPLLSPYLTHTCTFSLPPFPFPFPLLSGINDIIKSDRDLSYVSIEQAPSPSKNLTATIGSLGTGTLRSMSTLGIYGSRNRSSSLTGTLNLTGSLKFDVTVNQNCFPVVFVFYLNVVATI